MPVTPDVWHRTSVAIRKEHLEALNALLRSLEMGSASQLLNILATVDHKAVLRALKPIVDPVLEQQQAERNARTEKADLARQVRQVSDPAVLSKVKQMLERA
jgi:Zn-dependent M32 family carboxypeptidase